MGEITQLLNTVAAGDPRAAAALLPLVYDELRALATARMDGEASGHTLQPTALVHEAYLRLIGGSQPDDWNGRGHFFAAAAEAMRRILVEAARRKGRQRHGGGARRKPLDGNELAAAAETDAVDLIALSDALDRLNEASPRRAELVKLRYFAGLTVPEAADILGISQSTAEADWTYAKAWLKREMGEG
jgi:RNA polymerase sigma factor (TIGR02999 family)